jgi:hypothetical protein
MNRPIKLACDVMNEVMQRKARFTVERSLRNSDLQLVVYFSVSKGDILTFLNCFDT